jgi:hypothetical protein
MKKPEIKQDHVSELQKKCKDYLNDNFHKFSQYNKIKISLAILVKSMPTQLEGEVKIVNMGRILKNGKPMEFNVGD